MSLPVAVVGAGPVGLTTALGLKHYGIACQLFEDEERLSTETKAGTTLSRSLEIWRRFGARLAWNYRSEYFIDNDRGRQLYSDATDTLDLSINLNVTDNFAVTFDGVNLLDEELFQYYDGLTSRPARYYDNGPIYYFGVRVNFDGR